MAMLNNQSVNYNVKGSNMLDQTVFFLCFDVVSFSASNTIEMIGRDDLFKLLWMG
jgi:hypothetical protein